MINLDRRRIPRFGSLNGVNELYGLFDLIQEHLCPDGNRSKANVLEIGTYLGASAELFAQCCNEVITVDPRKLDGLDAVLMRNSNLGFMQMKSEEACKHFDDEFFDLVYIDAQHDYEDVKQDIKLWLPKVKKGGVIAGHDYLTEDITSVPVEIDWSGKEMGEVNKAVDECFKNVQTYKDSSWAVVVHRNNVNVELL